MIHAPDLFRNDSQICIVSPDAGGVNRAKNFKSYLEWYRINFHKAFNLEEEQFVKTSLAVLIKERN